MTDNQAAQTSLPDLLMAIPCRLVITLEGFTDEGMLYSSTSVPVGKHAHDAAHAMSAKDERIARLENGADICEGEIVRLRISLAEANDENKRLLDPFQPELDRLKALLVTANSTILEQEELRKFYEGGYIPYELLQAENHELRALLLVIDDGFSNVYCGTELYNRVKNAL